MAFRTKRSDTLIKNIEKVYGVDLRARSNMKLKTILENRGFTSQSQLLKAYRGELKQHPKVRRVFISFHSEDFSKAQGLRLMFLNNHLSLDLEDVSRKAVRSDNESYVRNALRTRISEADVVLCVLGNGTGSRSWVDWELRTALDLNVPICGVRIPGTYGKFPDYLKLKGAMIANWDSVAITKVVEATIARGA